MGAEMKMIKESVSCDHHWCVRGSPPPTWGIVHGISRLGQDCVRVCACVFFAPEVLHVPASENICKCIGHGTEGLLVFVYGGLVCCCCFHPRGRLRS